MSFRTDRHNNPIAFTVDIAKQAGLKLGLEYVEGEQFNSGSTAYFTAKLIGPNPVETCLKVIEKIGFYTKGGAERWIYIGIPLFIWNKLFRLEKIRVIQFMYHHEGGTELKHFFTEALTNYPFPEA